MQPGIRRHRFPCLPSPSSCPAAAQPGYPGHEPARPDPRREITGTVPSSPAWSRRSDTRSATRTSHELFQHSRVGSQPPRWRPPCPAARSPRPGRTRRRPPVVHLQIDSAVLEVSGSTHRPTPRSQRHRGPGRPPHGFPRPARLPSQATRLHRVITPRRGAGMISSRSHEDPRWAWRSSRRPRNLMSSRLRRRGPRRPAGSIGLGRGVRSGSHSRKALPAGANGWPAPDWMSCRTRCRGELHAEVAGSVVAGGKERARAAQAREAIVPIATSAWASATALTSQKTSVGCTVIAAFRVFLPGRVLLSALALLRTISSIVTIPVTV
jgi:hypothetical protein